MDPIESLPSRKSDGKYLKIVGTQLIWMILMILEEFPGNSKRFDVENQEHLLCMVMLPRKWRESAIIHLYSTQKHGDLTKIPCISMRIVQPKQLQNVSFCHEPGQSTMIRW